METVQVTYRILGKGLLGPWQAAAVTIALLALVALLLSGQLRRVTSKRLRAAMVATRLCVVLLLGWTLFQPSLFCRQETTRPGLLILLVDDSGSMAVRDEPEGYSDLLDLAEATYGYSPVGRPTAARDVGRVLRAFVPAAESDIRETGRVLGELDSGLPWDESSGALLRQVSSRWQSAVGEMQAACGRLRAETANPSPLKLADQEREDVKARVDRLTFAAEKVRMVADAAAAIASAGGSSSGAPADLVAARNAMTAAMDDVRKGVDDAGALRDALDRAFLASADESVRKQCEELSGLSRTQLVSRFLQSSPAMGALKREHRLLTCATSTGHQVEPSRLDVSGGQTDFLQPLRTILNEHSRDILSGVVLLSDGRHNSFEDLHGVLEALRARSIPVHAVLVGSVRAGSDLAIVDYSLPVLAVKGQKTTAVVTVRTGVAKGTPFRAALASGGEVLAEAVLAADGSATQRVVLTFAPGKSGLMPLAITLSADGDVDRFAGNNSAADALRVLDARARCLLVADVPSWDVQYLLRALDSLPVRTELVLDCATPAPPPRGAGNGKVPETAEQWGGYQLIALAGRPFRGFKDSDAAALLAAVSEKGRGLLLLPDTQGAPAYAEALAGAFGWRVEETADLQFAPPVALLHVPPVAVRARTLDTRAAWRRMSAPRRLGAVPLQPVVLLRSASGVPVISCGLYGKGRCVCVGAADAWRLREFDGWTDAERFLRETVALALYDPLQGAAAGFLPAQPVAGEPAFVLTGAPSGGSATTVSWRQGEKGGSAQCSADGLVVTFPQAGPASVTLGGGESRTEAQADVRRLLSVEDADFSTDGPLLEEMARATGGQFARLADFPTVASAARPVHQVTVRVFEYSLWHGVPLLVVLVGLVTLEYVLRRKAGMVL